MITLDAWASTVRPGGKLPNSWNPACANSRGTREHPMLLVRGTPEALTRHRTITRNDALLWTWNALWGVLVLLSLGGLI